MEINSPLLCEIERIVDGDTFVCRALKTGYVFKVRMAEMDAPEVSQPAGWLASLHLKELLKETDYKVYITPKLIGKNDRIVADVHQSINNAKSFDVRSSLNYRMVMDGLAWSYTTSSEVSGLIKSAEVLAKGQNLGLWGTETNPVHPSVWRKEKLKMNAITASAERVRKVAYCTKHGISHLDISSGRDFFNIKQEKEKEKTNGLKLNDDSLRSFLNSRNKSMSKFSTSDEIKAKDQEISEKVKESLIPEKMDEFSARRRMLLGSIRTPSEKSEEEIREKMTETNKQDPVIPFDDIDGIDFSSNSDSADFDFELQFDDFEDGMSKHLNTDSSDGLIDEEADITNDMHYPEEMSYGDSDDDDDLTYYQSMNYDEPDESLDPFDMDYAFDPNDTFDSDDLMPSDEFNKPEPKTDLVVKNNRNKNKR